MYVLALLWKCTAVQRKKGRQGGDPRGGSSGEKGRQKAPSASASASAAAAAASTQQMRACTQRIHGGIKSRRIWRDLPWAAAKFISIWASNAIAIYACCTVLYPPKDKIPRSRSSRFQLRRCWSCELLLASHPHFPFQPFSRHQIPRKKQPNSGCQACVLAFGTIKYKLMQTAKCNCTEESRAQLT